MKESYLPLSDYRVIGLGRVWAAPLLEGLLANLGAEVIKVESKKYMDSLRLSPDNLTGDPDLDPWFHSINRNKLSITLNLSHPRAAGIVKSLIRVSDVVVENFGPGVTRKLGLDYETLRQVKPDIIMVSMPGAGSYGSLKDVRSYASTLQSLSGLDSLLGYPGERIVAMQQPVCDAVAAIHGAFAVLAALRYRQETGEGQYVEIPQLETLISIIPELIMQYTMNGRVLHTQGNLHPMFIPHQNYCCKGEDKWVSIAIKTDDEWQGFCQAIGSPNWTKEKRFADAFSRWQNRDELDKLVGAWTINQTHYEVMEILQNNRVAAIPCLDTGERFLDPHLQEREVHVEVHPKGGTLWITGMPWKMSGTPCTIRSPAPVLGEHNSLIFGDLLGMSPEEISALQEEEVII